MKTRSSTQEDENELMEIRAPAKPKAMLTVLGVGGPQSANRKQNHAGGLRKASACQF